MQAYPELIPDRIEYSLGLANLSEVSLINSGPIRFRHSLSLGFHRLTLIYENRTLTEIDLLRDHYNDYDAGKEQFFVPASIWGEATVVDSTSLYRYEEPPEENHRGVFFDFTVSLRVVGGISLLYILQGGGATQSTITPTAFTSFAFTGNAPFIINGGAADPASPAATIILEGKGANR